jgi:hypothetical protein
MAANLALSSNLRARLAVVARRIRWIRAVRGLSVFALVLALTAGAALLADQLSGQRLPVVVRQITLSAWMGLGVAVLVVGLILPVCCRLDPEALAAVIERKYPELAERLTTSVELSGRAGPGHGSVSLIALLLRETEDQTSRLNFLPAVSPRSAGILAGVAGAVLVLLATPALVFPDEFAGLGRRFLNPWNTVETSPYTFEVSPGNKIVAVGDTLNVTVRIKANSRRVDLPGSATLVIKTPAGPTRHFMPRRDVGVFALKVHDVKEDFTYYIEANDSASADFDVTAIKRVGLAELNPVQIRIVPPQYAQHTENALLRPLVPPGLVDFAALQYGEAQFDVAFDRPAVAAFLEWTPAGGQPVAHRLVLADDLCSGTLNIPLKTAGRYRFVFEAEHGFRTEIEGGKGSIIVDHKPYFVPGSVTIGVGAEPKSVLAYDRVPIHARLNDDVGTGSLYVEYYRVGRDLPDKQIETVSVPLVGAGKMSATANWEWNLSGKVKDGETVFYRLRGQDDLPSDFGGPHLTYYPGRPWYSNNEDRWLSFDVVPSQEGLKEKQIAARQRQINDRLERIKSDLKAEKRAAGKIEAESRGQPALLPEHRDAIQDVIKDNRNIEQSLRDLVPDAAEVPEMGRLAATARHVADNQMRAAEKSLREAAAEPQSGKARREEFGKADQQLDSALKHLDALRAENDRLAKEQRDLAKAERLADKEQALADRAAELATKDPTRNPQVKKEAELLQKEQAETAAELQRLADSSDALKKALDEARAEQAREAAERAKDLAETQRELAMATAETDQKRQIERLADLTKKQEDLAAKQAQFARETKLPAWAAQTNWNSLAPKDAQKAVEALKQGDAVEAMRHQAESADKLRRFADVFDRALNDAKDPREAARQLARLENALYNQVEAAKNRKDDNPDGPLAERLKPLQDVQKTVEELAKQLSVPPTPEAEKALREANDSTRRASESLEKQDLRQAMGNLQLAHQALDRLAERMPALQQRQAQALQQLQQLQRQQDNISRQAEQGGRQPKEQQAEQLQNLARQQAEVAEALTKMDAPNQETRQERAAEAARQALADLLDRRPEDVKASQQAARREMQRLEQALRGQKFADEMARELAQQQKKVAAEVARAANDPKSTPQQVQELQRQQQQIANQAQALKAPEAPQRQADAAEATRQAAQAAQQQPTAPQTQQKMQEAARKLDELAKQLTGPEPGAERRPAQGEPAQAQKMAQDLAKQQRELAKQTQQAQDKAGQNPDAAAKQQLQKALDKIAEQQRDLNKQAARLPLDQQPRAVERARNQMNQAQQALAKPDAAQTQKNQAAAADALDKLAKQLHNEATPARPFAQRNQSGDPKPVQQGLPTPQQAEQARQLAREQQELRDALQKANDAARAEATAPRENPLGHLAKQQAELAKQAGDLAKQAAQQAEQAKQGQPGQNAQQAQQVADKAQQAADQAQQADRALQSGNAQQAQRAGKQAAEQMKQLASAQQGQSGQQAAQMAQEAAQMARQQEAINRQLAQQVANADAQRAQQQARQQNLQRQANELAQDLNRLAQQMSRNPQAQQAANQASQAAQQAQNAMQQAQNQGRQGNQGQAQQGKEQAAQALERAAQQASQAAQRQSAQANPMGMGNPMAQGTPQQQTGQAVQQAQGAMQQAQQRLGQGQPQSAQNSMQRAANSLQQVAQSLAQRNQPQRGEPQKGTPGQFGRPADDTPPDNITKVDDPNKYEGKAWGDLPGTLQTKIIDDLRRRYGDEHAEMIKRYYEQMAERQRK